MHRNISFCACLMLAFAFSEPVHAWDGVDSETGAQVEIGKGNLVRRGQDIEFYDYSKGEYRQGEVQDVDQVGSSVEVEIYDHETGDTHTLEMDGD